MFWHFTTKGDVQNECFCGVKSIIGSKGETKLCNLEENGSKEGSWNADW